jgi:hypothetical protein
VIEKLVGSGTPTGELGSTSLVVARALRWRDRGCHRQAARASTKMRPSKHKRGELVILYSIVALATTIGAISMVAVRSALTPRAALAVLGILTAEELIDWAIHPVTGWPSTWGFFLFHSAPLLTFSAYMFSVLGPWRTRLDRTVTVLVFFTSVLGYVVSWAILYEGAQSNFRDAISPPLVHHVDSLYFVMTTLATLGFGDFRAVVSASRWLVVGQMSIDLLIVGAAFVGFASRLTAGVVSAAASTADVSDAD